MFRLAIIGKSSACHTESMREKKEMANLAVLSDRGWGCTEPILTTEKNALELCVINFLWKRRTVYLRHIKKRI